MPGEGELWLAVNPESPEQTPGQVTRRCDAHPCEPGLAMKLRRCFLAGCFLCVSCGSSKALTTARTDPSPVCPTMSTSRDVLATLPAVFPVSTKGYAPTFAILVESTDEVAEVMRLMGERKVSLDASWSASYGRPFGVVESSLKPESDADGCSLADLVRPVPGAIVIDLRGDDRPTILAHSR
jgi:hypothetical protein